MPHILMSYAVSLLMGLLIGLEREHSHAEGVQPIGIRTFILFSLFGTTAAVINQLAITVIISGFVFSIIVVSYLRSVNIKRKVIDIGITTEVAAGLIYCLGYLTFFQNLISIVVSGLVLLVLLERQRLHKLARRKFKSHEIETTIILIIFALGVIPILPNYTIDPWHLFNPRNFGILIMVIAIIQFSGYVAIKLFGEQIGLALMGFLGGLVSSTAVFANLAPILRSHPTCVPSVMASGLLATFAMLLEVMVIIFVASTTLFVYILKPMAVMLFVTLLSSVILLRYQKKEVLIKTSPKAALNLSSLFLTSVLIGATLIVIAITRHFVGAEATLLTSFLTGLFEIHGISLATALLYLNHYTSIEMAGLILFVAIVAAFISKMFLLWSLTPARFAFKMSLFLLGIVASGGATYWLT